MPSAFYQEIEDVLTKDFFYCEPEVPSGDWICAANYNCDYIAPFLPTFSMSFFDDNEDIFTVNIDPEHYMLELGDSSCMLLITESSEDASFILGAPFFRATIVQLDFNHTQIMIYQDVTSDSPVIPTFPPFDETVKYEEPMVVEADLVYYGSVYIGNNFQTSDRIAYDTTTRMTVIPAASTGLWFNENSAGNVTVDATKKFSYDIGITNVECEMAYANICRDDAKDLVADSCAYMGFCLTSTEVCFLEDYEGIIGLGKWNSNETESNYVMQMYIDNHLNPEIYIDLNFPGQVNNIFVPIIGEPTDAIGFVMGNTTSHRDSDDWALEVTRWTWNGKTYDPEEEDVSDIALLQSSTNYLAVPEALFIDISFEMEMLGFDCTKGGQKPEENYCEIATNCTEFVNSLPEFSLEFNNSVMEQEVQYFSVQMFPEIYLMQSEDNSTCTSLIRQTDPSTAGGFVLGTPFFRNVSVILNFAESTIAVQIKPVDSPIAAGKDIPWMDENAQLTLGQTYMTEFGQYNGTFVVGEDAQGKGEKFAFSTSSYYTAVPSVTADGGWFNSSTSGSFDKEGLDIHEIVVGVWAGRCQMAFENMCFEDTAGDVGSNECLLGDDGAEMCLVTEEFNSLNYDFQGIVGFGKPETGSWNSLVGSTVGAMYKQNAYCPVATFDLNFEGQDSSVVIGCYIHPETMVSHVVSDPNSTQWALTADSAQIGTASVVEAN